jgi:hypothetical protein
MSRVVRQISSPENTGRCPRCHVFVIAEQLASHKCKIPTTDAKTIWLDWITDGYTDENNDFVRTAKSLDGTLYGLILCKHNPPHSLESRWLTGNRQSRSCNRASFEVLLHPWDRVLGVTKRDTPH